MLRLKGGMEDPFCNGKGHIHVSDFTGLNTICTFLPTNNEKIDTKTALFLVREIVYYFIDILVLMALKRRCDKMFVCLLTCRSVRAVQECKIHNILKKLDTKRYAPFCSALLTFTVVQLAIFRSNAL